jgi:hypothetical protein
MSSELNRGHAHQSCANKDEKARKAEVLWKRTDNRTDVAEDALCVIRLALGFFCLVGTGHVHVRTFDSRVSQLVDLVFSIPNLLPYVGRCSLEGEIETKQNAPDDESSTEAEAAPCDDGRVVTHGSNFYRGPCPASIRPGNPHAAGLQAARGYRLPADSARVIQARFELSTVCPGQVAARHGQESKFYAEVECAPSSRRVAAVAVPLTVPVVARHLRVGAPGPGRIQIACGPARAAADAGWRELEVDSSAVRHSDAPRR